MNTPPPSLAPRKLPRQARSQATVDAILEASAQVLVERGYAQASTNLIAERAGVSVGSLYQYFPHKGAIVAALHERHVQAMLAIMTREAERGAHTSLEDAIGAMLRSSIRAHEQGAELHRVLETHIDDAQLHDHDELDRHIGGLLQGLLESHRGEIAVKDLRLATFMLLHAMHALVHKVVFERPSGVSLRAAAREIEHMALAYLRTPR